MIYFNNLASTFNITILINLSSKLPAPKRLVLSGRSKSTQQAEVVLSCVSFNSFGFWVEHFIMSASSLLLKHWMPFIQSHQTSSSNICNYLIWICRKCRLWMCAKRSISVNALVSGSLELLKTCRASSVLSARWVGCMFLLVYFYESNDNFITLSNRLK